MNLKRKKGSLEVPKSTTRGMIKIHVQGNIYQWEKGRPWLKYVDDKGMVCTACTMFGEPNGMFVTGCTSYKVDQSSMRNVHLSLKQN